MTGFSWRNIEGPHLPRSSHSLSVVGNKAYIFGGEIRPRQPVDTNVHVIDLVTGQYEVVKPERDAPEARVGHTAAVIGSDIYIFGGRGGPDLTPLEEAGTLYSFSTTTHTWHKLTPSDPSAPYPCGRSYHCSTATSNAVIVHAGCGKADVGRLKDVWAFEIGQRRWVRLGDGPGDPRGGAAITAIPVVSATGDQSHGIAVSGGNEQSGQSGDQGWALWRFGGFNGKTELGGGIDRLQLPTISDTTHDLTRVKGSMIESDWRTFDCSSPPGSSRDKEKTSGIPSQFANPEASASGPGARSVTALLPLGINKLVTVMGEGKPSPTGGHDAAGNFWDDIWIYDVGKNKWEQAEPVPGDGLSGPGGRGWFAADIWTDSSAVEQGRKVVLWGGLNAENEREGDGWILTVD